MKILLSIFFIILIAGCATLDFIPGQYVLTGIDFTEYTKMGFLFTPFQYYGEYESIGMLSTTIYSEGAKKVIRDRHGRVINHEGWHFDKIDVHNVIDSLYNVAWEMGADAVINFKTIGIEREWHDGTQTVKQPGVEITGFAIRRLD